MKKDARRSKSSVKSTTYHVIDTNVIIDDPYIVKKIRGRIVIPTTVLQELDKHKSGDSEKARNVREFVRIVKKSNKIIFHKSHNMPGIGDEQILQVAVNIKKKGHKVVLLTNDILMSFLAKTEKIQVKQHVVTANAPEIAFSGLINERYPHSVKDIEYFPNEYILNDSGLYRNDAVKGLQRLSKDPRPTGIKHRNVEQRCALDALLNNDIKLVTISGKAGTGKTLMAIAAGLEQVLSQSEYKRLVVSRPIISMGNEIGFLPGDLKEKLDPWMQPIFDNIEFLMQSDGGKARNSVANLEAQGLLKLEALAYIRGRSIANQYIIIDEAQNLTKHEIKTIISRVGENTKIVITGDVDQIDNPKLDSTSNGLAYVIDKFKNYKIAAHITLTKCERSELADLAAKIL